MAALPCGLGKPRSAHLQAEAPGGEGRDAAGQDRAPEWGFALLVLIRTQPARLVFLPYGKSKGMGEAGQGPGTKHTASSPGHPGSHRRPQRPSLHGGLGCSSHLLPPLVPQPSITPAHLR